MKTQVYIDNCSSKCGLGIVFDSNFLSDNHIDKAVNYLYNNINNI